MAKHIRAMVVLCGLAALSLSSGAAPVPPQAASASNAPRVVSSGSFPVKVIKALDSSKLKEADTVEVETAGSFKLADGTLVPKGSKLVGHVTAAKARSKGDSDSELTVTFDKLEVANGKPLSVKGIVQAVFPPAEEAAPIMAGKASGAAGGGYSDATVGTVTDSKIGSNMQSSPHPEYEPDPATNPKTRGVHGVHDLELGDGVLSSKGKNVKLGPGVRMIVRAEILG